MLGGSISNKDALSISDHRAGLVINYAINHPLREVIRFQIGQSRMISAM